MRTYTRITCPKCGKRMYSLGYARHIAMHRDEENKAKKLEEKKKQHPL